MRYFWKLVFWLYSNKTCSFGIAKYKGFRKASRLRWECWAVRLSDSYPPSILWVATSYYGGFWNEKPPLAILDHPLVVEDYSDELC